MWLAVGQCVNHGLSSNKLIGLYKITQFNHHSMVLKWPAPLNSPWELVALLLANSPFYGIWSFIITFKRSSHWPPYWASWTWSIISHPISSRWVLILSFPRVNCLGHETDHSPPSNPKVRNEQSYMYLQSLIMPLWHVQGQLWLLPLPSLNTQVLWLAVFLQVFTPKLYMHFFPMCGTCSTCQILHNCHSSHTVDVKSKFDSNIRVSVGYLKTTCNDSQVRASICCILRMENVCGVLQVVVSLWMYSYIIFTVARYSFPIHNDTWLLIHTVVSFSLNCH